MSRYVKPTDCKFIVGARAFRVWLECDDQHPEIVKVFNDAIVNGRRVIVPESRFPHRDPIIIEENEDVSSVAPTKSKPDHTTYERDGCRLSDDT